MNKKLLEECLHEFKSVIKDRYSDWLYDHNLRFEKEKNINSFFKNIREDNFKKNDYYFHDFESLCHNIDSLIIDEISFNKIINWSKYHFSKEEYLAKFKHLIDTNIDVSSRIDKALQDNKFQLKYFDGYIISELIAHNEPNKYIHLTQVETQIIDFLDIHINKTTFSSYFKEFNKIVTEQIVPLFITIIHDDKPLEEIYDTQDLPKITLLSKISIFFSWILTSKKLWKIKHDFIGSIEIEGFYSIRETLKLSELKNKKFIFFLGENGSGKTILLKSILITLKEYFINEHTSTSETGIIHEIMQQNAFFSSSIRGYKSILDVIPDKFNLHGIFYLKNVFAYGTNRNKISNTSKREPYGFLTLFKNDEYLTNVEEWLKDIERKELKKIKTITLKQIEHILQELLDLKELTIEIREEKTTNVVFMVDNKAVSLEELSEGYRSIITLVIDLLSRLTEDSDTLDLAEMKAVVLIDELDMFLHPKWEKNICSKLHKWFPQIQFFIATHSPILIDGAVKDEALNDKVVLYRLKNEDKGTYVDKKYTGEQLKNWTPNLLINSELFDEDYLDNLPKDLVLRLRTENTENELLDAASNIQHLLVKEQELLKRYNDKLKNDK